MTTTQRPLLLFAALLLFVCAASVKAQETTARITGQITDSSGAVVPGAEITLTNLRTQETRTSKTGDDGYYSLTFIQPGLYDLSVKAQGFKEYKNTSIELLINDQKTINIGLETGALSETVTVTAEAQVIQTTPTVGDVIENRRVVEIPLNNRNFMQLVTLVPGVTSASGSEVGIGLTNTVNISIGGTRRNAINWLVDGVSNTDVGSSITLLSVPTVDAIQEIRIISSVPTAEFGRAGGGVVSLITRGGTSEFHGGLYEFLRNDKLNANSFFNNTNGRFCDRGDTAPPGKECGQERSPRSSLRYNNFGYNVGGPVWIPGIYEQRDKTFFFFSQEWRRIIRAPAENTIRVPSLLEKAGDFSEPGQLAIIDPLTGQPFPGNRIPANRIDPDARILLGLFPDPNVASLTPGRTPDRFSVTVPNTQNTRQETMRGDHIFNNDNRLMVRYTRDLSETRELGGLFFGISLPDIATTETSVPGEVLAVSLTSSFGPNIVNEASFNFSGNAITTNLIGQYTSANVPISAGEVFTENNSNLPPTLVFTGFTTFTIGSGQLFNIRYKNFNPKDNVTWVRGAHTIKFGGEVSFEQKNENAANETQGRFGFTGLQTRTAAIASGNAFADFLIGRASTYTEAQRDVTNHLRFGRTEFYVQDTWKVKPNLQLDLGVRYHLFRQPYDRDFVLTAFLPELFDPTLVPEFANATGTLLRVNTGDPLNGIARASVNSPFGDRVQKTDKNDLGPRLGFAWDPWNDTRTVIRGGYGVYYDQALVGIVEQNAFTNPPFNNSVSLTGTVANPILLANPSLGSAPTTFSPRNLITTTNPFVTPLIQQWNMTIQRELNNRASFEVGYLGSAGNHLIRPVDINAPTPQEILAVSRGVVGCDPALNPTNNPNTCINLARPFKGFGTITDRQTTATSRYHALISSFKLRPTHGLSTQVAYTWSKSLTDATNDRDALDLPQIRTDFSLERAVSRLDRTHVFVASYVYEVPFPTEGFLANPVLSQTLGGWQVAGGTIIQSGLPVTRIIQDLGPGPRGNRANLVGDPFANVPGSVEGVRNPFFFNPLAFRPTAIGDIGNSGRGIFRFPREAITDLSIAKNWRWGESYRVQFRAEFFNIFNKTIFTEAGQTLPANRLPGDPVFNSLESFLTTGSTLGQFTATRNPREIQMGLKFYF
jgi:outer membrane receptor protein involved in Fe transport